MPNIKKNEAARMKASQKLSGATQARKIEKRNGKRRSRLLKNGTRYKPSAKNKKSQKGNTIHPKANASALATKDQGICLEIDFNFVAILQFSANNLIGKLVKYKFLH